MMAINTCQHVVGLQAHVKKKSANPKKSTANSKGHIPNAHVLALANMSSDPRLVNVGNFSGMEDPNVVAKKKPIHIAWRLENKKQGIFHKEVKESVATSHTHLTGIPIDAKREIVGLRIMLQQAIKDASYAHLHLTIK
jgi:hypothetical protein